MNKKHIGSSFFEDVKQWEMDDPGFRQRVNEQVEKRKLAAMLKEIREKEHLTQSERHAIGHCPDRDRIIEDSATSRSVQQNSSICRV